MHAQVVVCYCLCNKPIWPIIATTRTIQISGLRDQTFKRSIYFLYRCLEVVTTYVCVIVGVACTWRYHACMPRHACIHVCMVLRVFHKPQLQACHTQVVCMYMFCVCLSWGWLVPYIATYMHACMLQQDYNAYIRGV